MNLSSCCYSLPISQMAILTFFPPIDCEWRVDYSKQGERSRKGWQMYAPFNY